MKVPDIMLRTLVPRQVKSDEADEDLIAYARPQKNWTSDRISRIHE